MQLSRRVLSESRSIICLGKRRLINSTGAIYIDNDTDQS